MSPNKLNHGALGRMRLKWCVVRYERHGLGKGHRKALLSLRTTALLGFTVSVFAVGWGCHGSSQGITQSPSVSFSKPLVSTADQSSSFASGMVVSRDPETGELRAATPLELGQLGAVGFNRSSAGLKEEARPDGSVMVRLNGRFMSASIAKSGTEGSVTTGCVAGKAEAEAFLKGATTGKKKEGRDVE